MRIMRYCPCCAVLVLLIAVFTSPRRVAVHKFGDYRAVYAEDHLYALDADGSVLSSWNVQRHAPSEDCWSQGLFNFTIHSCHLRPPIAVMGLGGGVIPARFSHRGIETTTIEYAPDVIRLYQIHFQPAMSTWTADLTTIHIADATTYDYTGFHTVIVDIPPCYDDIPSVSCTTLLRSINDTFVVVNVLTRNAVQFAEFVGYGRIVVNDTKTGNAVWTNRGPSCSHRE